eukprot:14962559-Alexandrium_andersonii.AAC.1
MSLGMHGRPVPGRRVGGWRTRMRARAYVRTHMSAYSRAQACIDARARMYVHTHVLARTRAHYCTRATGHASERASGRAGSR